MSARSRLILCAALALVTASACNALLGITDLPDPGPADADATDGPTGKDTFVPPADNYVPPQPESDAMAPCSASADPDPCMVVEPQSGGAIFPTWPITSDEPFNAQGIVILMPVGPSYADAGAGAVTESHTHLTWQTAYAAGGAYFDFAGATAACQALGPGWRVPTRIEIATTQYRDGEITGDGGANRTVCTPPVFDQSQHDSVWTSTPVPEALGDPPDRVYGAAEAYCGFQAAVKSLVRPVRCVKGDTRPATFVVSKSKQTVHAVDTGLVWERTGVMIQTYAEAKAHCDSVGARIPIIQELYGIIDTRTTALFHPTMFVRPAGSRAPHSILSQTIFSVIPPAHYYETVYTLSAPWGDENQAADDSGQPNILLRCVSTFVP
jgi:hypothetical protein